MDVDVIILTKSVGHNSISMTKRTIMSMQKAEKDYTFHFHLVESGMDVKAQYQNIVDNYIVVKEEFNYNRFINIALQYIKNDWVVISNNDVGYETNWFTGIMKIYNERDDIESFSPKDPLYYMKYYEWHFMDGDAKYFESYEVSEAIMGWSLVIKKTSLDKIIPFDENFDMYYQDNDYSMMLQKNGIKHALVRDSIASHLSTLYLSQPLDDKKKHKMTEGYIKYAKKWEK